MALGCGPPGPYGRAPGGRPPGASEDDVVTEDSSVRQPLPVGLIGYGAIGRDVLRLLEAGKAPDVRLVGVFTRDEGAASLPPADLLCLDFEALLARAPRLVIEAAGAEVLARFGPEVLARGIDLLCLSVSTLAERDIEAALDRAAETGGGKILVPSGAIAGLDAISAAASEGFDRVTLIQRKPPAALLEPAEAVKVTAEQVLYDGTARDTALRFPRNSNIAAAFALAGAGFDRTRVQVIADPAVSRNTVELHAKGPFGELRVELANVPSINPKTSKLTALSVIASLRRYSTRRVVPA